jgi:EGF-like domain
MFTVTTLVMVLVLSVCEAVSSNDCPADCEPNGVCQEGECVCDPGFAGADCSFPFQSCPDGIMQCFGTGAICVPISLREQELEEERQHPVNGGQGTTTDDGLGEPRYKCDCSAVPDASPFQIAQCENPKSQVCEEGQQTSDYAFCTNSGTCVATIRQGMPHAGCHCGDEFEGRHCQYRKGTAPTFELQLAYQEEKNDLDPIIKLWISLVCIVVLSLFAVMMYRKRYPRRKLPHPKFLDAAECGPDMYDQNTMSAIEVSVSDLPTLHQTHIYSGTFVYNEDVMISPTKAVDKTVDCSTDTEEDAEEVAEQFNGLEKPAVDNGEMA